MRKKHPPEQYLVKSNTVESKQRAKPLKHLAEAVAKVLVSWMERGGVPPSVILLHGLHLARSPENDELPVDTYRPQLKMQGSDNKVISEMLDALVRPQADKNGVIGAWLKSIWVKKSAGAPCASSQKQRQPHSVSNKAAIPTRKAQDSSTLRSVPIARKKR